MSKKLIKLNIPLLYVKPICIMAALLGVFFLVAGNWIAGLCMLLGAYVFEKSMYRCPDCGKSLDMKYPLLKGSYCPFCKKELR